MTLGALFEAADHLGMKPDGHAGMSWLLCHVAASLQSGSQLPTAHPFAQGVD